MQREGEGVSKGLAAGRCRVYWQCDLYDETYILFLFRQSKPTLAIVGVVSYFGNGYSSTSFYRIDIYHRNVRFHRPRPVTPRRISNIVLHVGHQAHPSSPTAIKCTCGASHLDGLKAHPLASPFPCDID